MDLVFADCVLQLSSRQLLRGGAEVPLEPKMFVLLEALIEKRPAVLTYAELDELLWPKVYVARTSLTRLVSELRTLLGDSGEPPIIRTVYKTGYAFAAPVTVPAAAIARAAPTPSGVAPGGASFSVHFDGRVLPLADGENLAGRGAECALMIDATTVSRRHARITVANGRATVEDLGSTNGTFVNGVAISATATVRNGDTIGLGKALLMLRVVEPSAPTEMITRNTAARRKQEG